MTESTAPSLTLGRRQSIYRSAIDGSATTTAAAPSRRMVWALSALALGLAILWLPVHATLPLTREAGTLGLVAQRLLEGYWPYAETWDHRGPVAYAAYAVMVWLCDDVRLGVCFGDLLFLLVAAFAMRTIGRRLAQPWLMPLGAIVLVLTVRDARSYGHVDHWVAATWLWVIAAFLRPDGRVRLDGYVGAGVVTGLAMMVKPTFLPLLALPVMLALRGGRPRAAAAAILACTATIGAILLLFHAADELPALLESYVGFNFFAHAGPAGDDIAVALARFLVTAIAPWFDVGAAAITLAAGLGMLAMWRHARDGAAILGFAWLLGLACALLQGKSMQHHFAVSSVVAALLAAYAVSRALHWLAAAAAAERQEFSLRLAICGAAAIAGIALALQVHVARGLNWWSAQLGIISSDTLDSSYCREDHCPADIRMAAEVIRRSSDRATPIFLFGSDAELYLAADRPPAMRFITTRALVSGPQAWRDRTRAETMAALRETPPHFIVVQDFDAQRVQRGLTSRQHLEQFAQLRGFLAERYVLAHSLGRFTIYRLRAAVVA